MNAQTFNHISKTAGHARAYRQLAGQFRKLGSQAGARMCEKWARQCEDEVREFAKLCLQPPRLSLVHRL